jgi:hypothetical protein
MRTTPSAQHLSLLALVVVHMLDADGAAGDARAAEVVDSQHRRPLVLIRRKREPARLACEQQLELQLRNGM